MKNKILFAMTAIASSLTLSACSSAPKTDHIPVYADFEDNISYTFDDTLKKTVVSGPVMVDKNKKIKYSILIDDKDLKIKYEHTYSAKEKTKTFFKVVDLTGKSYQIEKGNLNIIKCNGDSHLFNDGFCKIQETGLFTLEKLPKYKYQFVSSEKLKGHLDFEPNIDYLRAMDKAHKLYTSDNMKERVKVKINKENLEERTGEFRKTKIENDYIAKKGLPLIETKGATSESTASVEPIKERSKKGVHKHKDRSHYDNMTPEQKEAFWRERKEKFHEMSPEQKKEFREKYRAKKQNALAAKNKGMVAMPIPERIEKPIEIIEPVKAKESLYEVKKIK